MENNNLNEFTSENPNKPVNENSQPSELELSDSQGNEKTALDENSVLNNDIKKLEKEKLQNEIQSFKFNKKMEKRNLEFKWISLIATIITIFIAYKYTFSQDEKILNQQRNIEQRENELVKNQENFESEKKEIYKLRDKFELWENQLLLKENEFQLELINEKRDSLSKYNFRLIQKGNNLKTQNNRLVSKEKYLNQSILQKNNEIELNNQKLRYLWIDYTLKDLDKNNIIDRTIFLEYRNIFKENNDKSDYLRKKLINKLDGKPDLNNFRALYVLSFSKDSIKYKQQYLDYFIDYVRKSKSMDKYAPNFNQIKNYFTHSTPWNQEDSYFVAYNLSDLINSDFNNSDNFIFMIESVMQLSNTTHSNLAKYYPNIYIDVLKANNKLIQKDVAFTMDELVTFSPLSFSAHFLKLQNNLCLNQRNIETNMEVYFKFLSILKNDPPIQYLDDLYEDYEWIYLEEKISDSSASNIWQCKDFVKIYNENKKEIDRWTENDKISFFKKNSSLLNQKLNKNEL